MTEKEQPKSEEKSPEPEHCEHVWARRRDGKWCIYCKTCVFGEIER